MRLFIALDLSEEAINEISDIQKQIQRNGKFTFVKPENIHLTLKFLGEVPENKLESIKDSLKKVEFETFELKMHNIGIFPSNSKPRVLWIGFKDDSKAVELAKNIENALKQYPSDHDFKAHATILRIKLLENKKDFIENIKNIKVKEISFNINYFRLYKSTLTPTGPIYEVLEEYKSLNL